MTASLLKGGDVVKTVTMKYAGEVSVFEGVIDAPAPGRYTLRVIAADAANANFAMFTKELVVTTK